MVSHCLRVNFLYFCLKYFCMNRAILLILFLGFNLTVFGQNEVGPEGEKLVWVILVLSVIIFAIFLQFRGKGKKSKSSPLFKRSRVVLKLEKDSLYYPDNLTFKVKNAGNTDIDLDRPMLVFDNFWLKRKFRLKGSDNRTFYPLYLEKGKTHTLQIDLNRFYSHDKSLKKFPKAKVVAMDVTGKRLGSKSVYLRKTLFKF